MSDLKNIIQSLTDELKKEDIVCSDMVQQGKKVNGMVHKGGMHLSIFYDSDTGMYGFNMPSGGSKTYEDIGIFVRMLGVFLYIHTYFLPNARKVADVFEKVVGITTVYQSFEGNMTEGFIASFTVLGSAAKVIIREMQSFYIASYIIYPNNTDDEEVDTVFKYRVVDDIVQEVFTIDSYVKRLYNAYWDSEEFNISRLSENEFEVGYNGLQYTFSVEIIEEESSVRYHVSSYEIEDSGKGAIPLENCIISIEDYMDLNALSHRVRDFVVAHKNELKADDITEDGSNFDDSMLGIDDSESKQEEEPVQSGELSEVDSEEVEQIEGNDEISEVETIAEPTEELNETDDIGQDEEKSGVTENIESMTADESSEDIIDTDVVEDKYEVEEQEETGTSEEVSEEISETAEESDEVINVSEESASEETDDIEQAVDDTEMNEIVDEVASEKFDSEVSEESTVAEDDTTSNEIKDESEEIVMQTTEGAVDFSISRLLVDGSYDQLVINMPNTVYLITREDAEAHGIPTERIADSEELKKHKGMLLSESEIKRGIFGEIITGKDDKIAEVVKTLFS